MLSGIIKRLAEARKNAGLSQGQVDRILYWESGTTKALEVEEIEPSLRHFRLLCQAYHVSEVWALTGVNPYVDVKELHSLLWNSKIARDDLDKVLALLVTLPADEEVSEGS